MNWGPVLCHNIRQADKKGSGHMLNAGILEYLLNGGAVLIDSQEWSERSERNPWFGHGLGLKSRGATALLGTTANAIAPRLPAGLRRSTK